MSWAVFKLKKADTFTKIEPFEVRPTWHILTSRIAEIYNIPSDQVAVSYVDSDRDLLTIDNQYQLDHFYAYSYLPSQVNKLVVHDSSVPEREHAFSVESECFV
jgi:hypothetical protein